MFSGASTFRFRPRRERVDWRRINAVDIEMVVSQLDVDALQEHISTVTFCSLDGERCQRCQSPVDPVLVKLLQLAQLTVEWLLHCQESLCLNLQAAEERVAVAGRDLEQLQAQQRKQEEKVKELTAELEQRKISDSQKCLHCEKFFMNSLYLQRHMQRRHPDQYRIQLHSDTTKDGLKLEIISLKEQVVQQQQALQAKITEEKEQQNVHKEELQRKLDRFKAKERARMDRKIEDSQDAIRREWESKLQDIQSKYESEKNQLMNSVSRLQSSVLEQQERNQEMNRRLEEMEQVIRAQREQIKAITSNPLIKVVEVPVMQIRPRSSSLPFTSSEVMSGATVGHPKTPQLAPRTKTSIQPKTTMPNTKTAARVVSSKTPPFSSDEEDEDKESDTEEEPPRSNKLSKPRINQATPVQIKGGKTSLVQARHTAASQSFSKTPVESEEEDDDWSDVSLLEIDPKQVQGFKDQNGNNNKKSSEKKKVRDSISDLARQLEKRFAVHSVKKPAGGVSIIPERNDEFQELTDTDESRKLRSPLEKQSDQSIASCPLRKSLDSPSTSVWATSSGKGHKSGLTEAGIGSTLKSSLHSYPDISDSEEDDSNKHS